MTRVAFSPGEVLGAVALSSVVQAGVVALLVFGRGAELPRVEPEPEMLAVAVNPIIDERPILKKGTPNPKRAPEPQPKQPPPPEPVVEKSAPSPAAPTVVPKSPPPPVAKPDEKPAKPEDKPVVKRPLIVEREEDPNADEEDEGDEQGVVGGTEKDPLKARAISLYQQKLIAWFQQGFSPPLDVIPCPTLVTLRLSVRATIGSDGTVTGFTLNGSSGNTIFDARVRERMQRTVGQQVPPPPPNYPELAESTVFPTFLGKNDKCR